MNAGRMNAGRMNVGNRVLWSIMGLLLLGAGVLGVLANRGWLGVNRDMALVNGTGGQPWQRWPGWVIAILIVAGLVVAALGVLLVRAQVRGRGGAQATGEAGQTVVSAAELNDSLVRDLERTDQIRHAAVRVVGDQANPQLLMRLSVTRDADVPGLTGYVDRAVGRLARTSGVHPEVAEVTVTTRVGTDRDGSGHGRDG